MDIRDSKEDMDSDSSIKLYQIFRRFYRLYDDYFYVDSVAIFNNLEIALKFLENENDSSEYKWIHKDTYIVEIFLNQIYDGFQNKNPIFKKDFNIN